MCCPITHTHTCTPIHSISSEIFVAHTFRKIDAANTQRLLFRPFKVYSVFSVHSDVVVHILQLCCYYCYYFILFSLSLYRSGNSSICIDSVCSCIMCIREREEKPAHAIRRKRANKNTFSLSMFHWCRLVGSWTYTRYACTLEPMLNWNALYVY